MLSNFETLLYRTRRAVSFLLAVVLLVTGIQFPAYAESYSNYLDGWNVSCAWSTLSTDYTWNASTDSSRQPKLVVTYRLENAEYDYAAGDIQFDIPGIGNANRAEILMASDLASDAEDSEWDCDWDQENDIYTFKSKFTVSAGQSVSGGFELLWTLSARDTENEYTQSRSPVFRIKEAGGETGSITMTPITFTFTSVRDRYRISMSYSKLGASDWDASDKDYIWYTITTRFDKDWLARGLYRSSYYISVELPDGVDYADVIVKNGSTSYSLTEIVNEDGETVYGFYPFENRSGNLGGKGSTYSYSFQIGFLKDAFLQEDGSYGTVTVKGHLNRLYNDESTWVTTAGANEKVDAEVSFTIEDYGFTWAGFIYNHTKSNPYETSSHNAPSYSSRLHVTNIYNGKVVPFTLSGVASRNYASSYSLRSRKANTTGVSQVGINGNSETYALVLGDDKLAAFLTDGSIRNLTDDEYDMTYITVPSNSYGYDYEVFGAYTQDTDFEDYVSIGTGNTSSRKTIQFPDGIKAMYIRVNDIDGSYSYSITVGIAFHLDWDAEQAKAAAGEATVDPEGHLVDFSYLRSLYVDAEGDEVNDCALDTDNYSGSYGDVLAIRDQNVYGENLMRAYSNVWLRTSITTLATSTSLNTFTSAEAASGGFYSSSVSKGTISADDEGTLTSFSLYAVLPEGLQFDFENIALKLAGSGTYASGSSVSSSDFEDHVTYSVGEYNGKPVLIADFDFSDNPLEISATTTVSMSYGVTLAYTDYITYGNSYTIYTYLMVHDDGLDRITGTIMTDEYDIDGNGLTTDKMAYSSSTRTVSDSANEWREYVSKYVKSYYSSTYVTDTVTRLYDGTGDEESIDKSSYSYRLEFGLGASNAKNIDFFDRIEQGASIATNETEGIYTDIPTAWQGTFQSVDTSYAEKMGLIPTIYYSTDADQVFDTTDAGWTTTAPADLSTVKSIWIHLDTSGMENGMMKTKELTYVIINMLAPDDEALVNTDAVNQYYVQYDAYGITSLDDFEDRYELPSAETYITLLKTVGSITLAKVDGDHVTGTDSEGNTKYASLSGAVFQIYDEKGNALYGDDGVSLNAMNKVNIKNVEFGTYYWEEITAPAGYVKETGLHAFTIDENGGEIVIKNSRLPGSVTLTKIDADNTDYGPLADAEFELYTSGGEQVFVDDSYAYSESGTVSRMTTGTDGTLTVTNLPWGSYYFIEVTAPEGYELNDSKVSFTISKNQYDAATDTISTEVTARDEELTASILLKKKDSTDSRAIKNAVFSLYLVQDGDDKLINSGLKTNAAGELEVGSLKFGTYYFVETRNATGYLMPDGNAAVTKSVTLDASTAEQTLEISMTNDRMAGSVNLSKTDDAGQAVTGAEYTLYYKADGTDEYVSAGVYTTDSEGEISASDLGWGDYYFIETSAPTGYEVSDEKIEFTIDAESVQSTVYVTTVDMRKKGSIVLIKVDAEDTDTVLPDAVYELYMTDGTKCVLGTDYELLNGETEIKTGDDGTVSITGLTQGGYYLQEVTAPDSYTLSDEKIRFSITKESSEILQEITAEDIRGKASLVINKVINDIYSYYGNPTFLFKIEQIDPSTEDVVNTYYQSITLTEDNLTGSTTLTVDQGYKYQVTEINVNRYQLDEVTADTSNVDASTATADLVTDEYAEMTYSNVFDQYEKVSHMVGAVNLVKVRRLLTAISVTYNGEDPLTDGSANYDDEEEVYTLPNSDLTVVAFYDDGTEEVLDSSAFTILNPTVDGNSNSYTGTVEYEESGVTKTGTFSVDVDLPVPKAKYTISFNLDSGTIVKDGDTTNTAVSTWTYQKKEGSTITRPENDPVKDGYTFKGWYTDSSFTTEVFVYDNTTDTYEDYTVTGDTTFYALYEMDGVKVKYAVTIYGIQEDTDEDGNTVGLTFGPATGESYVNNNYEAHVTKDEYDAGELCLHWMTWDEIIEQSKTDPATFQDCLDYGCTHSVDLTITGALAGDNSYPDMSGDGCGALNSSINVSYRKWNDSSYNTGGWPASRIRAVLNGVDNYTADGIHLTTSTVAGTDMADFKDSDALIKAFPSELQSAIVSKAVKSDTVYNQRTETNSVTTYDKLWLFSSAELYQDHYDDKHGSNYEGTLYTRQDSSHLNVSDSSSWSAMINYREAGSKRDWWLRSLYSYISGMHVVIVYGNNGNVGSDLSDETLGISPGFCLPGPEPTTYYAVSLYGIEQDDYSEDGVTLASDKAGLTFGPATGASYWDSYVSHTPDGTTTSGNDHRCIHDDDWKTIAYWSQEDPYVYEQCIGTSVETCCTKSVPLYISEELAAMKYTGNNKPTGDGIGMLYSSLNNSYRTWNNTGSNTGGWPASRIRAVLNGADSYTADGTHLTTSTVAGEDMATFKDSDALISAFPAALQSAIVPKVVKSDTVYDKKTDANSVTTYDKLWLFSSAEIYQNHYSDTYGSNYEGTLYTRQDSSHLNVSSSTYEAMINYDAESESVSSWWLRSLCSYFDSHAVYVGSSGNASYSSTSYTGAGVAPGFSLK